MLGSAKATCQSTGKNAAVLKGTYGGYRLLLNGDNSAIETVFHAALFTQSEPRSFDSLV
jgi:hypothetical protein